MKIGILKLEDGAYTLISTDNEECYLNWQNHDIYELKDYEIKQYFKDCINDIDKLNITIKKENNTFLIDFSYQDFLNELKKQKLNELENVKTQAENADILYKDKYYQADNKAKELLTQSLVIFSSVGTVPENFVWKSSDNSLNAFSLDDLKNLSLLIAQRTQKLTSKYWAYKEQIKNANTKEELEFEIGFSNE